jgi:DNA-binding CsgD family transcriptional regulator
VAAARDMAAVCDRETVGRHLSSVYRKRGVRSRTELVRAMAVNPTA